MEIPKEIRTHCPYCKAHQVHKVSLMKKGKPRSLAYGNLRQERKLRGHGGKRAGKKSVKKQGKRQVIVLTCTVCGKKHQRVVTDRTAKKLEIKRS